MWLVTKNSRLKLIVVIVFSLFSLLWSEFRLKNWTTTKKELTIEWNIDELEISFSFVDYQSSSLCDCGEIKSYQVEMFHQVSLLCFAQAARKSHSSEAEMRRKGFKFASLSLALRFICWSSRSCFVNGEKVHVTRNWLHSRRLSVSRLNSWMRYSELKDEKY